jgi:hypothetical protein
LADLLRQTVEASYDITESLPAAYAEYGEHVASSDEAEGHGSVRAFHRLVGEKYPKAVEWLQKDFEEYGADFVHKRYGMVAEPMLLG